MFGYGCLLTRDMHTYTHTHTYMHAYTHIHVCIHTYMHACTHIHACTHTHICMHTHTWWHPCTQHTHTCTLTYSHAYTLTCIHRHACMYSYTCICMHTHSVTYTHTYTQPHHLPKVNHLWVPRPMFHQPHCTKFLCIWTDSCTSFPCSLCWHTAFICASSLVGCLGPAPCFCMWSGTLCLSHLCLNHG